MAPSDKPLESMKGRIIRPLQEFFQTEAIGGILLLMAAAAALIAANSSAASAYHHFLETSFRVGLGSFQIDKSIHHWINDGLMAVFFFLVGLEIKREMIVGELASFRKATLPLMAALGGMIVPAAFFLFFNYGGEGQGGWAIPMATDIAFALGALAILGKRIPVGILIFLTALAIVDDLGGVVVIALFYGGKVAFTPLLVGMFVLALSYLCNRSGIRKTLVYVVLGIILWLAFLKSGVHATLAGILMALTIPANALLTGGQFGGRIKDLMDLFHSRERVDHPLERAEDQQAIIQEVERACHHVEAPLQNIEHKLHPWVTYLVMPIFAFANAGVEIHLKDLGGALAHPVTLGIIAGLVLGKQIGVMSFSWFAVRLGWAELPAGVGWMQMFGVSCLAGIGFTMSLFIGGLAFAGSELLTQTKIGILAASLLSGVLGFSILKWSIRNGTQKGEAS